MKATVKRLIAITGGIGSGKSVVAKALRVLGYPVFDCDSEAKAIMDNNEDIKGEIARRICNDAIKGGCIDRPTLASVVFADAEKLAILNTIVHEAVKLRLADWAKRQYSDTAFVETAILYQSGLNNAVDAEWRVEAPEELRIARVMTRNNMSRDQVKDRIKAQNYAIPAEVPQPPVSRLLNDGKSPLLPRLLGLIAGL
ncbi:MAG: dephospho-CoA kinase [Muribaculaceae bacterium]|nr:dephospho-CoA kinase [Muribaculaceae bacterium]MDE6526468.1 dephospho-CoA kinase [Muribaculaceae bacterium]MDE6611041.1 dephospho-CoA kinase [Muribaculaceae bacterium]